MLSQSCSRCPSCGREQGLNTSEGLQWKRRPLNRLSLRRLTGSRRRARPAIAANQHPRSGGLSEAPDLKTQPDDAASSSSSPSAQKTSSSNPAQPESAITSSSSSSSSTRPSASSRSSNRGGTGRSDRADASSGSSTGGLGIGTLALGPASTPRTLWRRALRQLSDLRLAIYELAVIAGLSAVGTVIPQNKAMEYYMENYPDVDGARVFGFVTWRLIGLFQFDHVYVAPYFLALLALLGASLAACTTTRQWPMLRVARRWRFQSTAERVQAQGTCLSEALPDADVRDVGRLLKGKGFQVFLRGQRMYAFKGLAGRMGPIGVHASLLAIMAGVSLSGLGGWKGSVMVPEDGDFVLAQALSPGSPVAQLPKGAYRVAHVDSFRINYRPDGSVQQFNSQISVSDLDGRPMQQQEVSVNAPLRVEGVTAYQTDWSIAACVVRAPGSPMMPDNGAALSLPMASLEDQGGVKGRAWATFVPSEPITEGGGQPKGVSIIARDFQSVALYDSTGKFVGVRRPGSNKPIEIEGLQIFVDNLIGATGLELKVDPGVPYVYAGFGGLMLTTIVSYLSHSQIWALQEGTTVHLAGKTNRATVSFSQELSRLLDEVPERLAAAPVLAERQ